MFHCLFFVLYMYSVRIYSRGGYFQIRRSGGLGPRIRFGGKIWGKVRPSSQNKRKNLGCSVTKRRKSWEKVPILGSYLKFRGQNLGYLSFMFLEAKFGLQQEFQRPNLGPSPPPRPPNMEVPPPWEFTSGVKDVTFVLTYIWFIMAFLIEFAGGFIMFL